MSSGNGPFGLAKRSPTYDNIMSEAESIYIYIYIHIYIYIYKTRTLGQQIHAGRNVRVHYGSTGGDGCVVIVMELCGGGDGGEGRFRA